MAATTYTRAELGRRAQRAVAELLASLDDERRVQRFVDNYVVEFSRPELQLSPVHYRELLEAVRRECLLALASRVGEALPALLAPQRKPRSRAASRRSAAANSRTVQAFQEEFLRALVREMDWRAGEAHDFRRDLVLYAEMDTRARGPRRKLSEAAAGPFVDRCALLLDPSLYEQARGAAGRFQAELESLADAVLARLFSPA